jgi:hypothetical protein
VIRESPKAAGTTAAPAIELSPCPKSPIRVRMRATDHALASLSTRWSGWSPRRRSAAILATLWVTPIVLTTIGLAFVTSNYRSDIPGSAACSSYSTGPNYAMWVVVAANAVAAIGTVATFICPGLASGSGSSSSAAS